MAHALRYLTAALLLGFVSADARAQPPAAEQAVRFTVFSVRPVPDLGYTPRTGQGTAPLVFYPTARSPRYDYRGAMPIRLVDTKTSAVVAEANVPATITDALLLLVPNEPAPATGVRYQVYVLDDTAARQAPGTLAIINFSGLVLDGTINGKPAAIQAGLNAAQPINRSASVALRTTVKNRNYQAYAGTVELEKNERALLLLLPPYYKGSPEVQSRLLIDNPARSTAAGVRQR